MRCRFCGYLNPDHSDDCSRDLPDADKQYWAGWEDGRVYAPKRSDNPAYLAGWYRGEIAAEVAANTRWSDYYDL